MIVLVGKTINLSEFSRNSNSFNILLKISIFQVEDIAAAKEAKRLAHQLNRVKAIKKEIKTEEAQTNAKEADRTAKRTEKQLRPGKYGPGKLMVRKLTQLQKLEDRGSK